MAASLYSFIASAFFIIWSASALPLASMAKASASPFSRKLSDSASASKIILVRWASAIFSNLKLGINEFKKILKFNNLL